MVMDKCKHPFLHLGVKLDVMVPKLDLENIFRQFDKGWNHSLCCICIGPLRYTNVSVVISILVRLPDQTNVLLVGAS